MLPRTCTSPLIVIPRSLHRHREYHEGGERERCRKRVQKAKESKLTTYFASLLPHRPQLRSFHSSQSVSSPPNPFITHAPYQFTNHQRCRRSIFAASWLSVQTYQWQRWYSSSPTDTRHIKKAVNDIQGKKPKRFQKPPPPNDTVKDNAKQFQKPPPLTDSFSPPSPPSDTVEDIKKKEPPKRERKMQYPLRTILTLNPMRMVELGQPIADISNLVNPTFPYFPPDSKESTAALSITYDRVFNKRFPEETKGVLYYWPAKGKEHGYTETGDAKMFPHAEIRFRLCSSLDEFGTPTNHASPMSDLYVGNSRWRIKLADIRKKPHYASLLQILIDEKLYSPTSPAKPGIAPSKEGSTDEIYSQLGMKRVAKDRNFASDADSEIAPDSEATAVENSTAWDESEADEILGLNKSKFELKRFEELADKDDMFERRLARGTLTALSNKALPPSERLLEILDKQASFPNRTASPSKDFGFLSILRPERPLRFSHTTPLKPLKKGKFERQRLFRLPRRRSSSTSRLTTTDLSPSSQGQPEFRAAERLKSIARRAAHEWLSKNMHGRTARRLAFRGAVRRLRSRSMEKNFYLVNPIESLDPLVLDSGASSQVVYNLSHLLEHCNRGGVLYIRKRPSVVSLDSTTDDDDSTAAPVVLPSRFIIPLLEHHTTLSSFPSSIKGVFYYRIPNVAQGESELEGGLCFRVLDDALVKDKDSSPAPEPTSAAPSPVAPPPTDTTSTPAFNMIALLEDIRRFIADRTAPDTMTLLAPMDKTIRQDVHDLARHFHLKVMGKGTEGDRHIILSKTEKTRLKVHKPSVLRIVKRKRGKGVEASDNNTLVGPARKNGNGFEDLFNTSPPPVFQPLEDPPVRQLTEGEFVRGWNLRMYVSPESSLYKTKSIDLFVPSKYLPREWRKDKSLTAEDDTPREAGLEEEDDVPPAAADYHQQRSYPLPRRRQHTTTDPASPPDLTYMIENDTYLKSLYPVWKISLLDIAHSNVGRRRTILEPTSTGQQQKPEAATMHRLSSLEEHLLHTPKYDTRQAVDWAASRIKSYGSGTPLSNGASASQTQKVKFTSVVSLPMLEVIKNLPWPRGTPLFSLYKPFVVDLQNKSIYVSVVTLERKKNEKGRDESEVDEWQGEVVNLIAPYIFSDSRAPKKLHWFAPYAGKIVVQLGSVPPTMLINAEHDLATLQKQIANRPFRLLIRAALTPIRCRVPGYDGFVALPKPRQNRSIRFGIKRLERSKLKPKKHGSSTMKHYAQREAEVEVEADHPLTPLILAQRNKLRSSKLPHPIGVQASEDKVPAAKVLTRDELERENMRIKNELARTQAVLKAALASLNFTKNGGTGETGSDGLLQSRAVVAQVDNKVASRRPFFEADIKDLEREEVLKMKVDAEDVRKLPVHSIERRKFEWERREREEELQRTKERLRRAATDFAKDPGREYEAGEETKVAQEETLDIRERPLSDFDLKVFEIERRERQEQMQRTKERLRKAALEFKQEQERPKHQDSTPRQRTESPEDSPLSKFERARQQREAEVQKMKERLRESAADYARRILRTSRQKTEKELEHLKALMEKYPEPSHLIKDIKAQNLAERQKMFLETRSQNLNRLERYAIEKVTIRNLKRRKRAATKLSKTLKKKRMVPRIQHLERQLAILKEKERKAEEASSWMEVRRVTATGVMKKEKEEAKLKIEAELKKESHRQRAKERKNVIPDGIEEKGQIKAEQGFIQEQENPVTLPTKHAKKVTATKVMEKEKELEKLETEAESNRQRAKEQEDAIRDEREEKKRIKAEQRFIQDQENLTTLPIKRAKKVIQIANHRAKLSQLEEEKAFREKVLQQWYNQKSGSGSEEQRIVQPRDKVLKKTLAERKARLKQKVEQRKTAEMPAMINKRDFRGNTVSDQPKMLGGQKKTTHWQGRGKIGKKKGSKF